MLHNRISNTEVTRNEIEKIIFLKFSSYYSLISFLIKILNFLPKPLLQKKRERERQVIKQPTKKVFQDTSYHLSYKYYTLRLL